MHQSGWIPVGGCTISWLFCSVSFLVNGVSTTSLQKLIGNDGGGGGVVRGLVLGTIMISSLATSYKNGSESLIGMVE